MAGLAAAAMIFGSSMGVLTGGVIADRTSRHDLVAACGPGGAAGFILIVGEADLSMAALTVIIAMAGFCSGLVAPSRDLIVRAATPEGSTGLSVGGVVTPPVYGGVLDAGGSRWMYWMTAAIMALAIATVISTGKGSSS